MKQASTLIATSALAKAWGLEREDKSVRTFLDEVERPAHEMAQGRGTIKLWDRDRVLVLKQKYLLWRNSKYETKTPEQITNAAIGKNNLMTWHGLRDQVAGMNERVDRLESKIDRLLNALGEKG